MDLMNVGLFFLMSGIVLLAIHFVMEMISVIRIKKWIKKNKDFIIKDEKINNEYKEKVEKSEEYIQLKELYDENLFLIRRFAKIGMNYIDFLFFQSLIGRIQDTKSLSSEIEYRVRKLIWITLLFEISMKLKKIALFSIKFSGVYTIVAIIYIKLI